MTLKTLAIVGALLASVAAVAAQQKPPAVPPAKQTFTLPSTAAAPAQAASWDGSWSGSFGARMDVKVTIKGEAVTAVSFFGAPAQVVSSSVSGSTVRVVVPEFSLVLTRFTATAAQTIYENTRQEKAVTLLNRS